MKLADLKASDIARFAKFIESSVRDERGCLIWSGSLDGRGYGSFQLAGVMVKAHRVAFVIGGGIITQDSPYVLHQCDNRCCCEYEHLFAGNSDDNIRDMALKNRGRKSKIGLPYGVRVQASGRYQAQTQINGHRHSLGTYDTPEEASAAAMTAKLRAITTKGAVR